MARRTTKTSTNGKPWARYLRLSKAESAEINGLSKAERLELTNRKLDGHLERITRWMDGQGLPSDDQLVFRDPGLSAYKPNVRRPGWEALMERAQAGEVAGIAGIAVDRFTRIVSVGEDLIALAERVDVKVGGGRAGILDLTTYEGITMFRGMVQQAAHESLATSFRLKERLEDQMRAGKPMGGGRPYGFEVVGDKYVIEVPQRVDEVGVIREVAADFLAGKPLAVIATELNDAGITTSRDGRWTGGNLGRMLGLARYGGEVERDGEVIGHMPGEPVLDRDTYDACRAKLASRRRGRRATGRYLLTGIMACSNPDCAGVTMNGGATYARPDGTRPRVYKCPPLNGGCGRAIMAEPVEELVTNEVVRQMADPRNLARIAKQTKHLDAARSRLKTEQKALEDQQETLTAKWAAGELRDATYERALTILNGKLAKVDAALKRPVVDAELNGGTTRGPAKLEAARLKEATEDWTGMTTDQKRETLKQYRVRPVIHAKTPGTRWFQPDRVEFL